MITIRRPLAAAAALLLLPLAPGGARARELTTSCQKYNWQQEGCLTYDSDTGENVSRQECSYSRDGGNVRCKTVPLTQEDKEENARIRAERRQAKPAKTPAADTHKPVNCMNYVIVGSEKQCLN